MFGSYSHFWVSMQTKIWCPGRPPSPPFLSPCALPWKKMYIRALMASICFLPSELEMPDCISLTRYLTPWSSVLRQIMTGFAHTFFFKFHKQPAIIYLFLRERVVAWQLALWAQCYTTPRPDFSVQYVLSWFNATAIENDNLLLGKSSSHSIPVQGWQILCDVQERGSSSSGQ